MEEMERLFETVPPALQLIRSKGGRLESMQYLTRVKTDPSENQIPKPESGISTTILKEAVSRVFGALTPRGQRVITSMEELVLKMRFGLSDDGEKKTFREIGEKLNVTGEYVRQTERRVLKKMQRSASIKKIKRDLSGLLEDQTFQTA